MRSRSAAAMPDSRATRGICQRAYSGEMCGSRPDADDVTASAGTEDPARKGLSARSAAILSRIESANFSEVGPRFVPPDAVASYPASPAAEGRGWKNFLEEKD